MRTRAVAMAIVAALAAAACGSSTSTTASPAGTTQANPCAKSNLQLVTSGQLTIGTDNPAFDPYFQGPTGHEWTGEFNHDPYNDQGFEDATAYAVAQQLGFTKDQVKWVAVPFNNSYKPGPKNFDFYLAQVSYSPQRAQGADLSDSYYDVQQAVVALQGTPIASAKSVSDLQSYKFGTQIGTTSYDLIQNVVQPSQSTQVYDTLNAALQALKNGQIDGLVTDFPTAYYMPRETAEVLGPDGWLRTGDLVHKSPDGTYTFVGRRKEVIRRRGENVAPAAIEEALCTHADVTEAAVIGVPSDLTEEEIKGFVAVADPAAADLAAIREAAAALLTPFKVPRYLEAVAELPHTPTGRIAKHELPRDRTDAEVDFDPRVRRAG